MQGRLEYKGPPTSCPGVDEVFSGLLFVGM